MDDPSALAAALTKVAEDPDWRLEAGSARASSRPATPARPGPRRRRSRPPLPGLAALARSLSARGQTLGRGPCEHDRGTVPGTRPGGTRLLQTWLGVRPRDVALADMSGGQSLGHGRCAHVPGSDPWTRPFRPRQAPRRRELHLRSLACGPLSSPARAGSSAPRRSRTSTAAAARARRGQQHARATSSAQTATRRGTCDGSAEHAAVRATTTRHPRPRRRSRGWCEPAPASDRPRAAQPSHDLAAERPFDDFDVNAVGTLNLLEAARRHCPGGGVHLPVDQQGVRRRAERAAAVELETRWDYADPADADGIDETMPDRRDARTRCSGRPRSPPT